MNLQTNCVANGAAVMMLIILILSSRRSLAMRTLDEKLFRTMVFLTGAQCVIETVTYVIDGIAAYRVLSIVLNSMLFINNISFAFFWTVYADFKIFESVSRMRKRYCYVAIPAILVTLGSIVNLFTPVFFKVSAQNVYSRTSLYVIAYIFTYMYLIYGVVIIYKYRNTANKYLFLPAIIFMIPIVIGSLLQYVYYGLSLIWLGAAIALVSIYINVQNQVSYTDSLTGLFTRQYMNRYLDTELTQNMSGRHIAGIMLDIDRFKSVNDNYGHLVGDDAIRVAGNILRKSVGSGDVAVRFAGDEFVIICLVEQECEIQHTIDKIEANTCDFNNLKERPYSISFSIGYTFFDKKSDTLDSFVGRMDDAMYNDKKAKKVQ